MKKLNYRVVLLFVLLSLLGLLAVPKLSLRYRAGNERHSLTITYSWPNATPEAIENQVTSRIEGVVNTMPGVLNVKSSSGYGSGHVSVGLDEKVDIDKVRFELTTLLRQLYRRLPVGVSYPLVSLGSPEVIATQPLMIIELQGNVNPGALQKYAEEIIGPRFASLRGLVGTSIYGGSESEWILAYDARNIQNLGLTESDIISAISRSGKKENIGWTSETGTDQKHIALRATTDSLDLGTIIVGKRNGRILRINDLTKYEKVNKQPHSFFRVNGVNAVQIVITARNEANHLTALREVLDVLQDIRTKLPRGYQLRADLEQSRYIQSELSDVFRTGILLLAIFAAFLVLTLWKRRNLLIVTLAIPANLLLTCLYAYLFGVPLYFVSLTALWIALPVSAVGVIMLCYRLHEGVPNYYLREPVVSALVCGSVFALASQYTEGRSVELQELVKMTIISEVSFVSIYFFIIRGQDQMTVRIPARFGRALFTVSKAYERFLIKCISLRRWLLCTFVLAFGIPLFLMPVTLDRKCRFAELYNTVLGNEFYVEHIKPVLDKASGGALRLFAEAQDADVQGQSRDRTALFVMAGLPNHSTIEQMDTLLQGIERELLSHPQVEKFITHVSSGQQGNILIYFHPPFDTGRFPYKLKAILTTRSIEKSGVTWNIFGVGKGFNQNPDAGAKLTYSLVLRGYNHRMLGNIAAQLQRHVEQHPRVQNVDINRLPGTFWTKDLYVFSLTKDEFYASVRGVSSRAVREVTSRYDVRPEADIYQLYGSDLVRANVIPQTLKEFEISSLRKEPMAFGDSAIARIGDFTSIQREKIVPEIVKENQHYLRQVSFEYLGDSRSGQKYLRELYSSFSSQLPLGFSAKIDDGDITEPDPNVDLTTALMAVMVVCLLAAVIFESVKFGVNMLFIVLFSHIGYFLSLVVFQDGISHSGIGASLLVCGLAATYTVVVQMEYRYWSKKMGGTKPYKAIVTAIRYGCIPILSTVLLLIASFLPIAILNEERSFWRETALGVIGGLVAYIFCLLVVFPIITVSPRKG